MSKSNGVRAGGRGQTWWVRHGWPVGAGGTAALGLATIALTWDLAGIVLSAVGLWSLSVALILGLSDNGVRWRQVATWSAMATCGLLALVGLLVLLPRAGWLVAALWVATSPQALSRLAAAAARRREEAAREPHREPPRRATPGGPRPERVIGPDQAAVDRTFERIVADFLRDPDD